MMVLLDKATESDYHTCMSANHTIRKTCKRYNDPGHVHELTFSCFKRRAFFKRDTAREFLAHAVNLARRKHRFDLWAYVVMPEHVHLIIWPQLEPYSTSQILWTIKQSVARRAANYLRKNNPQGLRWLATGQTDNPYRFWLDGGGYDRNIKDEKTLLRAVTYIHANPVRRGLVARPQDWLWSSYRDWAGLGEGPIPIDKASFPLVLRL